MKPFYSLFNYLFLLLIYCMLLIGCKKNKTGDVPNESFTIITTLPVSGISPYCAISGGKVSFDNGELVINRGICWSSALHPSVKSNIALNGSGNGNFTSDIIGLSPNTKYYVRAFAIRSYDTTYGNEISFQTQGLDSVFTDTRDGQSYPYRRIGTQTWMLKNLNFETSDSSWCWGYYPGPNGHTGAENCAVYGRLYSWNAAKNAVPAGWHLPSNDEWQLLIDYLGGASIVGVKMRAVSTLWRSPNGRNVVSTNCSGFSALPAGIRYDSGAYDGIGFFTTWWTSTVSTVQTSIPSVITRTIMVDEPGISNNPIIDRYYIIGGFSVRCIKD